MGGRTESKLRVFAAVVLLGCMCLLPGVSSHELCTDGAGPKSRTNFTLPYCGGGGNVPYNSKGCCDLTADAAARSTVTAYGINSSTDPNILCLSAMKLIACSKCDPWSAHLWDAEGSPVSRGSPWLCSIVSGTDFGIRVWNNCSNVIFANNPFTGQPGRISDVYNRTTFFSSFCKSTAPAYCYNGKPYSPTAVGGVGNVDPNSPIACLDKISSLGFIGMTRMPRTLTGVDTRRALAWTQTGRVTLLGLPPPRLNDSSPPGNASIVNYNFLLLASRVLYDQAERGLLGVALHPNFNNNGRFFVSYACNATKFPDCTAPCQCPLDPVCRVNPALNSSCPSVLIVAEYKASSLNATGGDYALSTSAIATEVRTILKFGRTWDQHNGGQMLFKPGDTGSYLYYFSGDGQPTADTISSYAQNPLLFQGKILRLDVDNIPPNKTYGIPPGNPFVGDPANAAPEIWALGLRNPWSNSFDALTGRLFTGDVGYNSREEVDLIEPGNNYGWKYYEGTLLLKTLPLSGVYGQLTSPIFEYTHSGLPSADAAITGGLVWRSQLSNQCMWGRYLFNNYRALPFWLGTVNPVFGQPYTTEQLRVACWNKTANACPVLTGSASTYFLGYMEDHDGEVYITGFSGVYRLVDTSLCGKPCLARTVELAHKLAPTMSSVASGSPALTVDGMFSQDLGSCAQSLNSTGPWWSVDLAVTANISSVTFWLPTGSAGTWVTPAVVEVSSSPISTPNRVTSVCPSPGLNTTTGTLTATCGSSIGRFVSITLPGINRILAICEVQVYGRALSAAR